MLWIGSKGSVRCRAAQAAQVASTKFLKGVQVKAVSGALQRSVRWSLLVAGGWSCCWVPASIP